MAPKDKVFGHFGQKYGIDFGQFGLNTQVLSSGHSFFSDEATFLS